MYGRDTQIIKKTAEIEKLMKALEHAKKTMNVSVKGMVNDELSLANKRIQDLEGEV
jgi:hypothetical protein